MNPHEKINKMNKNLGAKHRLPKVSFCSFSESNIKHINIHLKTITKQYHLKL